MLIVVRLRGEGAVDLSGHEELGVDDWVRWELVLTTEDAPFAPDPSPPRVDLDGPAPSIRFARPSAVILRGSPVDSASGGVPSRPPPEGQGHSEGRTMIGWRCESPSRGRQLASHR